MGRVLVAGVLACAEILFGIVFRDCGLKLYLYIGDDLSESE